MDRIRRTVARCLLLTGANLQVFLSCFAINFLGTCAHGKALNIFEDQNINEDQSAKTIGFFIFRCFYDRFLSKSYTCWMCLHRLATGTKILRHCNAEEAEQNVRKKRERAVPSLLSVQNSPSIMLP